MDESEQFYEQDATGWRRGVYEDVEATFRAPVVNWFFRALMANEPAFTRYMWGQVKPLFGTRAFGRYTVAYRDAVLSAVEEGGPDLPHYRRADIDLQPAEWRELGGQLATFDVVAPRLSLLFTVCDRSMNADLPDSEPADASSTEPLPPWLDRDRGRSVTMTGEGEVPDTLAGTVDDVRAFHGLDGGLPSLYRCLAQWPAYLDRAWSDLESVLESDAFERGRDEADTAVETHVEQLPYTPRLSPTDLAAQGFDESTIEDLQAFVGTFGGESIETVVRAIPVYAATVGAAGERSL